MSSVATQAVEGEEPPQAGPATAVPIRRPTRITLRRLDLRSVAKVSLAFYLSFVALLGLLVVVSWVVAAATGLIHRLEHLIQNLFGFTSFHFQPARVLIWGLVVGASLALAGTFVNVLAAVAYNLVARRWGGVRVTLADDDLGFPIGSLPPGAGRIRPLI